MQLFNGHMVSLEMQLRPYFKHHDLYKAMKKIKHSMTFLFGTELIGKMTAEKHNNHLYNCKTAT